MTQRAKDELSFWSRTLGPFILTIVIAVFGFVLREDFLAQQRLESKLYDEIKGIAAKIERHMANEDRHVDSTEKRFLQRSIDVGPLGPKETDQ